MVKNNPPPDIQALLELMAKLRDPATGCPWDLEQTFESIAPFTLEETYEVIEAIEKNDIEAVSEELGDLLLQIVFYCQIAQEKGWFDFSTVVEKLKTKLTRRHPHVFEQQIVKTSAEQHKRWEAFKAKERAEKKVQGVLGGIPQNFPALVKAQKLQNRAAQVGFDWPTILPVLDKVQEELKEFENAYREKDMKSAKEELGDILFACVNLARHLHADAETIMRQANRKFERRFKGVEEKVVASTKAWEEFTLEELEVFWTQVKQESG